MIPTYSSSLKSPQCHEVWTTDSLLHLVLVSQSLFLFIIIANFSRSNSQNFN